MQLTIEALQQHLLHSKGHHKRAFIALRTFAIHGVGPTLLVRVYKVDKLVSSGIGAARNEGVIDGRTLQTNMNKGTRVSSGWK